MSFCLLASKMMLLINGIVPELTWKLVISRSERTPAAVSMHTKSLRINAPTWKKVSNDSNVPVDASPVYCFESTVMRGLELKSSPASGIPSTHVIVVVTSVGKPAAPAVGKLVP